MIREKEVRVIDANGTHLGLMSTAEALARATEAGLDLVEVASGSPPHVCRIMDYGHYRFEQAKRQKEAKKKQKIIVVKEIKMRPRTDDHDFDFKISHAKRFLEHGNKVKFTVVYRGREMAYKDLGRKVIERIESSLADFASVESKPKMEGRALQMVMAPLPKTKKRDQGSRAEVSGRLEQGPSEMDLVDDSEDVQSE